MEKTKLPQHIYYRLSDELNQLTKIWGEVEMLVLSLEALMEEIAYVPETTFQDKVPLNNVEEEVTGIISIKDSIRRLYLDNSGS